MRRAVVDRVKIDQRQLLRLPGANQEHGLGLALAIYATVHEDVRPGAVVRELLLVIAEQSQREIIAVARLVAVVPGDAVHARISEVLVGFLAEKAQEVHLHYSDRFVGDLKEISNKNSRFFVRCQTGDLSFKFKLFKRRKFI